ncbi:hypothetical protein [Kineothrix sp. MB12-C1]|uniref:hypothetical protein n=1 Tax=Kineothrix sp. MB12-C1 TaxID=3070215 RepID=UPI0027D28C0D|nr:hypothetical protein [Kineothrix sp. MB12-C1]WMC92299.1 hypothetical protein RBB56_15840 [Kineothrix sp. MB12-C1]
MIIYKELYFENKKTYLIFKQLSENNKNIHLHLANEKLIKESDVMELWNLINKDKILLPVYNIKMLD